MRSAALAWAAGLLLAAGCSGSTKDTQPGGGTTGQGGASTTGGTSKGGASSGGSSVSTAGNAGSGSMQCGPGCIPLCEGGDCSCFCTMSCEDFGRPALDKSCVTDADCFAGIHTLDCCGSKEVLGYNVAEERPFGDYEADCTARALCRCAAAEPTLEDGQVTSDLELRTARCNGGQCLGTGPVNIGAQ